jgi:hypothetical protein
VGRALALGEGEAVADGVAVDIAAAVARAVADGIGVDETALVGVEAGVGLVAATVAVTAGLEAASGFTNVFEGASGGGVTSAFIFARARSEAERSVSAAQVFSTVACVRVSFTVCGRSIPCTLVITGADISRTSPRIIGFAVSLFISTWRWRRYRSIGCWLRERISSYFGPSFTTIVLL